MNTPSQQQQQQQPSVWSQPTTSFAALQQTISGDRPDASRTSADSSLSATADAAADSTNNESASRPSFSDETPTTGRRLLFRTQSQLDRLVEKMVRISRQNHEDKKEVAAVGDRPSAKSAKNDLVISGDFYLEKGGRLIRRHGLNWLVAALFIVADMAGGGIVALPTAIVRCSFTLGLMLLLLMAVLATSSSILLGKAWVILLRLYPQYRTHCRKPYAEIGYRACGPRMKTIVSICLNVTQFGASTVFLLLIAKNSDDFLRAAFGVDVGMCLMIVVVALLLLPITLLKSPQDFWAIVVLGMASTGIAVALVCVGATLDHDCFGEHRMPPLQLPNVLIALGTIMFTFGGHSALPTIQHDMRRPAEFGKSSILAFTLITGMNLIAVLFGGLTYGDSLRSSVINSIQTVWIQQAINLMILAHCLLTFTLIINPLNQEIEEYFNVPQGFGASRVIVRMIMMALAGLMAATVPNFDSILSLIGGLAFTLISMTFPCLFYLYLSAADKRVRLDAIAANNNGDAAAASQQGAAATVLGVSECSSASTPCCVDEYCSMSFMEMIRSTEPQVLFLCGIICLVGAASGAIATIMAVKAIATGQSSSFSQPCYASLFTADNAAATNASGGSAWSSLAVTNCCGTYQNISLHNSMCTQPDFEFYRS